MQQVTITWPGEQLIPADLSTLKLIARLFTLLTLVVPKLNQLQFATLTVSLFVIT